MALKSVAGGHSVFLGGLRKLLEVVINSWLSVFATVAISLIDKTASTDLEFAVFSQNVSISKQCPRHRVYAYTAKISEC